MRDNIVFLNGDFMELRKANLSLVEPAFLYGWSLFETMRAYKKRIVYLRQHLERLKESCPWLYLKFPYSFEKMEKLIFRLIELNKLEDAYVRLTLFKNIKDKTSLFIWTRPYQPYPLSKYLKGFRVLISKLRINRGSYLTSLKSGNYLVYQLSYLQANKKGFDEAIILNDGGYLAEATRSNIFLVKKGNLFTPSLDSGCLKGITRQVILDIARKNKIKTKEADLTLEDLYRADEAFVTNSLIGVMPLASVEKRNIGKGNFKLTKFFMKEYNFLLKDGT